MKNFLKLIVLLLFIIGLGVAWILFMPKTNIKSSEVAAEIEANDLYEAFEEDEAYAEEKYLGKVVIVEGRVMESYEDENGAPVLIMGEADHPVALITFDANQKNKIQKLASGDIVKAKALCSGMLMEVVLNKGILLK